MINKLWLASLLMGVFIISCGEEETTKKVDPIDVKIVTVGGDQKANNSAENFPGIIKPLKSTTLSFQVSGDIIKLNVNLGDFVKKGEVIASIDPSIYREQYLANKAKENLAKENYTRINNVYQKGSIAEIRMIEAKSNYEQAQSAANAAYKNLKHTTITAPFSGYVGNKLMEAGDVASPGMAIIELVDLSKVQSVISLSDGEINNYSTGNIANVYVPALKKEFAGTLTEIAVQPGKQNPVYTAKITVENPNLILKPGMTCSNFIEESDNVTAEKVNSDFIKLPVDVVSVSNDGENFVYIVDEQNNTALQKIVKVGKLYNDGIAIENGLRKGDKVITSGYHKLTNKTPVNILSK
jgi:RND family efflux transporter MFP subunit